MKTFLLAIAVFLLLNLAAGFVRIMRGPTIADRMLAVQLIGTTSLGILLFLAAALDRPTLHDVALVFALLAAVLVVALVRRAWRAPSGEG